MGLGNISGNDFSSPKVVVHECNALNEGLGCGPTVASREERWKKNNPKTLTHRGATEKPNCEAPRQRLVTWELIKLLLKPGELDFLILATKSLLQQYFKF